MPHKIYQCCDRNICDCGSWEKYGESSSDRAQERKEKDENLKKFTTMELENEVKFRKNKETLDEIKELENKLNNLKAKLK